jgi:hypothetical protein
MANNVTRMPRNAPVARGAPMSAPQPGQQSGNWWWDGTNWNCGCDFDGGTFPGCPPPGFPPPGCPPWFSGMNSPPWYPGANAGISFGTTSPPNPVRGHMWWDGGILWLFDGAAWVDVGGAGVGQSGGGASTGTSPPTHPNDGMLWFNGSVLQIWDGNAWVPVSSTKSYIQPTAPPAPNPGDTWYDGKQMRIWDGTTWQLVGPGATVGPVPTSTLSFSMVQSANLSIPPSTGTTFTETPFISTPTVDTMSGWNPTTRQYTPNKQGYYLTFLTGWTSGAATAYSQAVLRNDQGSFNFTSSVQIVTIYDYVGQSVAGIFSASGVVWMNGTTDYLRHWSYAGSGIVGAPPAPVPTWTIMALP